MPQQRKRTTATDASQSTQEPERGRYNDIHELVAVIELTDVVFYEERGRRMVWGSPEPPPELPSYDNSMGVTHSGDRVEYRFRVVFTDQYGEYVSDVGATYALPDEREISNEVHLEFAQRVAFMTVYPYVRASVFGSAARLGFPAPVMGIVRPGDFQPGEPMSDDAVREAFHGNKSERVQ